ncbi:MAG: hypothetical protein ACKOW1_10070, partial [Novosphingobium sp.]
MTVERVAMYVDGFNLYHALCELKSDHLKWLNLWKLGNLLIKRKSQKLVQVSYFSAYADFLKGTDKEASIHRHKAYVAALEAKGVKFDLPPSEWPNFYFRIGHDGGMEWRGSTSRKISSGSCVKRRSCWRRAE